MVFPLLSRDLPRYKPITRLTLLSEGDLISGGRGSDPFLEGLKPPSRSLPRSRGSFYTLKINLYSYSKILLRVC